MKNTLTNLWRGEFLSYVRSENTAEEAQLLKYLNKHFQDLREQLDEKGKGILEKYAECYEELACIECEEAFVKGFSLGVKLVAEALLLE